MSDGHLVASKVVGSQGIDGKRPIPTGVFIHAFTEDDIKRAKTGPDYIEELRRKFDAYKRSRRRNR